MNNKKIAQALVNLGFNTGWVVKGDTLEGIEWIEEPTKKPTKKEIQNAIDNLPTFEEIQQQQEAQKELKISAYKKLGLTDEEIAAII